MYSWNLGTSVECGSCLSYRHASLSVECRNVIDATSLNEDDLSSLFCRLPFGNPELQFVDPAKATYQNLDAKEQLTRVRALLRLLSYSNDSGDPHRFIVVPITGSSDVHSNSEEHEK